MSSKKKLTGLVIVGSLTLLSISGLNGNIEITKAYASTESKVIKVNNYIDNITRSLKNNYLGLKNVSQWNSDIKKARDLNNSISSEYSYSKSRNNESLDKAQALVDAAASVNQVEKSMSVNALSMKNVKEWDYYIDLAKKKLKYVDLTVFKYQHDELVKRADKRVEEINIIKKEYYRKYNKVEEMYFEAIRLEDRDMEESLRRAKVVKRLALELQSHQTKDFIVERAEGLIKRLDDDIVSVANKDYKIKIITGENSISELNNGTYNQAIVYTWSDFRDKRITHLTANTLIIRGGSDIVLNNCNIGRLIIEDYNNNIKVTVEGETIIDRAEVKSGVTFSRTEDFMENHKDPMNAAIRSMDVDTVMSVNINTQVGFLAVNSKNSLVDIGSYAGTIKLNGSYGKLIVSRNGLVDNLYVNSSAVYSSIQGKGQVISYRDNSYGSKMLMENPPLKQDEIG